MISAFEMASFLIRASLSLTLPWARGLTLCNNRVLEITAGEGREDKTKVSSELVRDGGWTHLLRLFHGHATSISSAGMRQLLVVMAEGAKGQRGKRGGA